MVRLRMAVCPKCGEKLSKEDVFCPECGEKIAAKPVTFLKDNQKDSKSLKKEVIRVNKRRTIYVIIFVAAFFSILVPLPHSVVESYTEQEPYTDEECTTRLYDAKGGLV